MFRNDLCAALQTWMNNGDQLVLMIDANKDVQDGALSLRSKSMGLISVLQSKFGKATMSRTFQRGSVLIDDISISPSISTIRAGMLESGNGPDDHRAIFVDVKQEALIGADLYKIHRQPARRLLSTNPVVVDRFNQDYEYQLSRNHVHEQMLELYNSFDTPMTQVQIDKYEKLDRTCMSAFHYGNKRFRKLRMGAIPSSEETTIAGLTIRLWTYVIGKKTDCKVSSRLIQRTAAERGVDSSIQTSVEQAVANCAAAWTDYCDVALMTDELRESQLDRLAEIIAKKRG